MMGHEHHEDTFVATAHPVGRFVLAIALLAAACVLVWWAGIVAPRLSATASPTDLGAQRGSVTVVVRNEAPVAFELRGLSADYPGIELGPVRVEGHDLSTGSVEVGAGATARVEAQVRVDCRRLRADNPDPGFWYTDELFRFTFGMPIGVERTRTVRVVGALNGLLSYSCAAPPSAPGS